MLSGCGSQQTPTLGASASPAAAATPAPTAGPAPAYADTLRIGFVPGQAEELFGSFWGFRQASVGAFPYIISPSRAVHSALYRFDAGYDVGPDLADGPCEPQGDGTVIRCRLIETAFHDGTPVTADDVAYTYQVAQRWDPASWWLPRAGSLREVRVVDNRTVDFVLASVDPTFLTTVLPAVPILPRHAIEASYAAFVAGTSDLTSAGLRELASALDEELGRDPPLCSSRVDTTAALLGQLGVTLYREDFTTAGGTFQPCAYVRVGSAFIRQAAVALGATGLDAVAAAWQLLSIDWQPVGAGPYRLVAEDANRIHMEAWAGYSGGPAATRYLDFIPTNPDGSDLVRGTIDVLQYANLGAAYRATAGTRGVKIAAPLQPGFIALHFNARPGRLFAERDLRLALQLCVDLARDVDTATGGTGEAVYGPVLPGSWADEPALPKPARDPAAARRLIEGAGWTLGADGIYARDGVRLSAEILTRAEDPERVKMADLIAMDARDCGIDLRSRPTSWDDLTGAFAQYPHDIPGTNAPFDLFLAGWVNTADPGMLVWLVSSEVTGADRPNGFNFGGFTDPIVDRLATAAMATYDQAERARLYREAQREVAAQVPMLFLWADKTYDAVRAAVTTVDGPLDLEAPNWTWRLERLVVAPSP
jgi:peptide/nickel transport system substrate-binding protein